MKKCKLTALIIAAIMAFSTAAPAYADMTEVPDAPVGNGDSLFSMPFELPDDTDPFFGLLKYRFDSDKDSDPEKNIFSMTMDIPSIIDGRNIGTIETTFSCVTDVTLPESLISLGAGMFSYSSELRNIIFPESLKEIGYDCFSTCEKLETVDLPESLEKIFDRAFVDCEQLAKVIIPDAVDYIGKAAFENCHSLSEVKLPESLTAIDQNTFLNCISLDKIEIPESVKKIGEKAFANCEKLSKIELPESLTEIGDGAFVNCPLGVISIPDSVISFGDNVFGLNEQLRILCGEGSAAEKFAKENNIPFRSFSKDEKQGDVDGDTVISSADALEVLLMSTQGETISDNQMKIADYDFDYSITSADALAILRESTGMEN